MVKAKVLFVDDEEHIVSTLRSLCRNACDVYTATSGAQALEIVKSNSIHVIVSDQRMPEMAGIELLREVKRLSPATMRIMLTGYADFADIVSSINDGEVYRYIYKPWNNKEVLATVIAAAEVALSLAGEPQTAPPKTGVETAQTNILVVDDAPEVHTTIKKLFEGKRQVWSASNCERALDILERENIGVVVSDVFVGRQDITQLLKILKDQHPHMVTVVLTTFNDANMVVGLINNGQIFRYLTKPVHTGQLRVSIEAALLYHAKCQHEPRLLSRHRVEKMEVGSSSSPTLTAMIMSRLKFLRSGVSAG